MSETTKKKPVAKKASKKSAADKTPVQPGERRRNKFDFEIGDTFTEPREGTKRATVARLLRRKNGATIQEVMKELDWPYATAYEGIKLLHTQNGFGLEEADNGKIKVIEPELVDEE